MICKDCALTSSGTHVIRGVLDHIGKFVLEKKPWISFKYAEIRCMLVKKCIKRGEGEVGYVQKRERNLQIVPSSCVSCTTVCYIIKHGDVIVPCNSPGVALRVHFSWPLPSEAHQTPLLLLKVGPHGSIDVAHKFYMYSWFEIGIVGSLQGAIVGMGHALLDQNFLERSALGSYTFSPLWYTVFIRLNVLSKGHEQQLTTVMLQVGTITLLETIGGSSCQIDETVKFPLYIPFYCRRNLLQCMGVHVGFASEAIHAMATSLVGLGLVRHPSQVNDFQNMPWLPLFSLPSVSTNYILLKGKMGEAAHAYKVQVFCTLLY